MRRICWDRNLVRQLFTTEADTKLTRDSFLRLHQPFERIRVLAAKPYAFAATDLVSEDEAQFTSEQGLLRAFHGARLHDPNRIFVLTGEPGAGKSHLARWLCHMLEDSSDRIVIHIPRRINTLVDVLKRLSETVGLQLNQEPSSYLAEAPPTKVVRYLLAYLDMAVGPGTPAGQRLPLLSRVSARTELESVLAHQVARYQAARRVGTADGIELIMVPEEDFVRMSPGGTLPERAEAYAALRHHLTEALRKLTNLDRFDLRAEMERISGAYVAQGKRPVLILEDITSFDLLHDDLLTFLLDEAAGHFDALVCWTTGFEKAYMRTYQLDRYAARLSLSDENMEVYALQGDGFHKMVKGYLDVVKPWCKRGVCDLYDQCVPAFQGLYPFNPSSLERIYENLIGSDQQHRRTPRNLLDRAIKGYLEIAEGHGAFPPIQQPAVVRDILYADQLFGLRHSHPAFVALLAWYGQQDTSGIKLQAAVANLLGVTVPAQYLQGDMIVVPTEVPQAAEAPVNAAAIETLVADTEGISRQLAASNKLKELRLELQSWATSLKPPAHAVELTRAIHRLFSLFKLRLPVPLGHPYGPLAGVTYGKQLGESNLTLAGTKGKSTPAFQFMLTPDDAAAHGRMHEVWGAALTLHATGDLPADADLALLSEWCSGRYAAYRKEALDRLEATLGMPLEEWVLAAKWTLVAALSGNTDPSYVELIGGVPSKHLPQDLVLDGLDLAEAQRACDDVTRLVDGMFAVAKGVYDAPRIQGALGRLSPEQFLKALAAVSHTRIDPDYRLGAVTQFRDLVRTVKGVASFLLQTDVAAATALVGRELTLMEAGLACEVDSLRKAMDDVRRLIGLTERYDLYDPAAGSWWDQGQGALLQAEPLRVVVSEVQAQGIDDAWSYGRVVREVARLRENPGLRAAYAAARLAELLSEQLELGLVGSPLEQLRGAVEALQAEVQLPEVPVGQALDRIEVEVRKRESKVAWTAYQTLRQELAGD